LTSIRHNPVVRGLIFDFDGLVMDTETPIFEIWRAIYAEQGQRLELVDWQHALGTHGGFDPVAHLESLVGRRLNAPELADRVRREHWAACETLSLAPGVRGLIEDGRRLGAGTALASSSPRSWVEAWVGHHRLRGLFDAVCAREDVHKVKPAPDLFLRAAARMGVASGECLVWEDSPNGILAATAAGMRCVGVRNAVTRGLALPPADLLLDSLEDVSLVDVVSRLKCRVEAAARSSETESGVMERSGPYQAEERRGG
jgi:HAD superfamily hydrolase (TIGR01509 family)